MRETFIRNLRQEGLIVEETDNEGNVVTIKLNKLNRSMYCHVFDYCLSYLIGIKNLRFATIFAPQDVLRRYAEILKIRFPLKKFSTVGLMSVLFNNQSFFISYSKLSLNILLLDVEF